MTKPTTESSSELHQAVAAFFPEVTNISSLSDHANLVRVETPEGTYRVHRWATNVTDDRIEFVHALLKTAGSAGLDFIPKLRPLPDGSLIFQQGQQRYDATNWITGRTPERHTAPIGPDGNPVLLPAPLSTSTHEHLTRCLAEFHEATTSVTQHRSIPRVTIRSMFQAIQSTWQSHRARLRSIAPEHPVIQRWLRTSERAISGAEHAFARLESVQPGPSVVCHLNIWSAHIILGRREGQEQVVGLVDFTEASVALRLLDLAQITSRFSPWSDEIAELVTGSYNSVATLTPEERRLLPVIAALDLVAEAGRLLILAYTPIRRSESEQSLILRDAADTLTRSLVGATMAMERAERPSKVPRRQWIPHHRPMAPRHHQPKKS